MCSFICDFTNRCVLEKSLDDLFKKILVFVSGTDLLNLLNSTFNERYADIVFLLLINMK